MILSLLTFCVAFMPSVLQVILHFLLVTNSLGQRIHNGTHHSWSEEVQGNETTLGRSTNATTWIPGTYVYISSDNFESYLKGLDVSYFLRKLALLARPVVSIHSQDDDGTWEIETSTLVKSHRMHFTLNQEVEDTTLDGRNVLCRFQLIGPNRLLETQTFGVAPDKRQTTIERQFSPRGMSVILKVGDVTAYSNFARKMN